jgi:hypothetical protein
MNGRLMARGKFCFWDMWKIQIEAVARTQRNSIRLNLIGNEKQMTPSL